MSKNRIWTYVVSIAVLALLAWSFFAGTQTKPQDTTISNLVTLVNDHKIKEITIDGDTLNATENDGTQLKAYKEDSVSLTTYGITPDKVTLNVLDPNRNALLTSFLSFFLPAILIGIFFWLMMRQAQGGNNRAMSFGQTKARVASKQKATFNDVAGLHAAKIELMEVVDFLKHPNKFKSIGAETPKGVLLVGAPGVGKTLLAKAVAGEAGVPFFHLSASEFVEMFVGVGAARVRDLFTKAKRNAPAVIFIDELDAIGRQRGTGLGGSHDEREQTLNQILVEMDGFETDSRVIVIAATNRPDVLDPALLRPGRFDRRVILELPDRKERVEILKLHLEKKSVANDVNLDRIAAATPGASGADLKNITNEAAILAAREGAKAVTQFYLESAIEKVLIGPERRSMVMSEEEKNITAYHEVGHALVGHFLTHSDPIHKISLVSRGSALGYTWSLPDIDRHLVTRSKFEDEIAQALAGREAEKIIFNEATTGAENDLKRATKIARDMVRVYGMSEKLGAVQFGQREEMVFLGREIHEERNYSESVATSIDAEVNRIVKRGEERAHKVLTDHRALLDSMTKQLVKVETIDRDEFEKLVGATPTPKTKKLATA